MLEKEITPRSSNPTEPRMKDGEEPTGVLMALVSSPLITLKARGLATIITAKDENGNPVVLAVFSNAVWESSVGIISANELPTLPTEQEKATECNTSTL